MSPQSGFVRLACCVLGALLVTTVGRVLAVRGKRVRDGECIVAWAKPAHATHRVLWRVMQAGLVANLVLILSAIFKAAFDELGIDYDWRAAHSTAAAAAALAGGGESDPIQIDEYSVTDYLVEPALATSPRSRRKVILLALLGRLAAVGLHALFALVPSRRRALGDCLGSRLLPLCGTEETASRTIVIGLCGSSHMPSVLIHARGRFRTVPAGRIPLGSLICRHDGTHVPLASQAAHTPLGLCDAFLSHAWIDPAAARFEALQRWRVDFLSTHGRDAIVWIDQFCIDAASIQADLSCLAAYIAGCRKFVMLAAPSYASRLWCVLELVTFFEIGGDVKDVVLVPLSPSQMLLRGEAPRDGGGGSGGGGGDGGGDSGGGGSDGGGGDDGGAVADAAPPPPPLDATTTPQAHWEGMGVGATTGFNAAPTALGSVPRSCEETESPTCEETEPPTAAGAPTPPAAESLHELAMATLEALARFDVRDCRCYHEMDRQWLLASIDTTFGSRDCFNRKVRLIARSLLAREERARQQTIFAAHHRGHSYPPLAAAHPPRPAGAARGGKGGRSSSGRRSTSRAADAGTEATAKASVARRPREVGQAGQGEATAATVRMRLHQLALQHCQRHEVAHLEAAIAARAQEHESMAADHMRL